MYLPFKKKRNQIEYEKESMNEEVVGFRWFWEQKYLETFN